jgi:mxaA protein
VTGARRLVALALLLWMPLARAQPATDGTVPAADTPVKPAEAAIVEQPRPFGYVLGDVLSQRILLQSAGRAFEPAVLPSAERINLWLARRNSRIESRRDGQRWLVVDYQLINAPQSLMTINLPAWTVKPKTGAELAVPLWPISVTPLTPRQSFAKGGLQDLRPDRAAAEIPTEPARRRLEGWSAIFALTLLTWGGWWLLRYWQAAANQPFARAFRQIRRSDEREPQAWLALHRAMDHTAGRAVNSGNLSLLFRAAPYLEPQRAAIERFYALSSERFFATVSEGNSTHEPISVRALSQTLRQLEKRNER